VFLRLLGVFGKKYFLFINMRIRYRFENSLPNWDPEQMIKKQTPSLKGQCHEMVAEISPWSGRLGLN
jgi:hypothetical protein